MILASSRSDGNTRLLARSAFSDSEADYEDLSILKIAYYSYDHHYEHDDFLGLIRRLQQSPLWILATPLHWYTMSAQAKTFMDRLSDVLGPQKEEGRRLRGKALAVLCSGADAATPPSFDEPFVLTCRYLGMRWLGTHYAQFSDRIPQQPTYRERAASFAKQCLQHVVESAPD